MYNFYVYSIGTYFPHISYHMIVSCYINSPLPMFLVDDFGQGSGSILLDEVACTISDKEIGLCDHSTWG